MISDTVGGNTWSPLGGIIVVMQRIKALLEVNTPRFIYHGEKPNIPLLPYRTVRRWQSLREAGPHRSANCGGAAAELEELSNGRT